MKIFIIIFILAIISGCTNELPTEARHHLNNKSNYEDDGEKNRLKDHHLNKKSNYHLDDE